MYSRRLLMAVAGVLLLVAGVCFPTAAAQGAQGAGVADAPHAQAAWDWGASAMPPRSNTNSGIDAEPEVEPWGLGMGARRGRSWADRFKVNAMPVVAITGISAAAVWPPVWISKATDMVVEWVDDAGTLVTAIGTDIADTSAALTQQATELAKGAWAEYAPEDWAGAFEALPEAVQKLPFPIPTLDEVRAHVSENKVRWALTTTVPVTVVASGVLTYKEYHRLNDKGDACWAHLGETYRTRGLAAWYQARHTDPCGPPVPKPSPPPPPPEPIIDVASEANDTDYADWTTPTVPTLAYRAERMVAEVQARVADLVARAKPRLARPYLRYPVVAAVLVWIAQLLAAILYALAFVLWEIAAGTAVRRYLDRMAAAATQKPAWRKSTAQAAIEAKMQRLCARLKERDRGRQAHSKGERQTALLGVLRGQEARAGAADTQAALAKYDRGWALLTGLYSLERAGLPGMSREELEGIASKQWDEFDLRYSEVTHWVRYGALPAADAQWLHRDDMKAVIFQRLARMPCLGHVDPWQFPARKDVLAAARDLPALDPARLTMYIKPEYACNLDLRPAARAFWPEAMAMARLHPLMQSRYIRASGADRKAGLKGVLAALTKGKKQQAAAATSAPVSSTPTSPTPRTTTFTTVRLVKHPDHINTSNNTSTTNDSSRPAHAEVLLFSARVLPGGGLCPTASARVAIHTFLLPKEAQNLAWALARVRQGEFRHAHPPTVYDSDDDNEKEDETTSNPSPPLLGAASGAAAEASAPPTTVSSGRTRVGLQTILPHVKAYLDAPGLASTLLVVMGAKTHDPRTVAFPFYCEVVWGIRAGPATPSAKAQDEQSQPTQLELEAAEPGAATGNGSSGGGSSGDSSSGGDGGSLAGSAPVPAAAILAPARTTIPIAKAIGSPNPSPSPSRSSSLQVITLMATAPMPMDVVGQVLREKAARANSGSLNMSPSRWGAAERTDMERTTNITTTFRSSSDEAAPEPPVGTGAPTRTAGSGVRTTTPKTTKPPHYPKRRRRLPTRAATAAFFWLFVTRVLPLLILGEILRFHVQLGMANREAVRAAIRARRIPTPGSTLAFLNIMADIRAADPEWPARCKGNTTCPIRRRPDHDKWTRLRQLDPDRGRRLYGIKDEKATLTPCAKGQGWWWEYL